MILSTNDHDQPNNQPCNATDQTMQLTTKQQITKTTNQPINANNWNQQVYAANINLSIKLPFASHPIPPLIQKTTYIIKPTIQQAKPSSIH